MIEIAGVIAMFFAAPIVFAVSIPLAALLVVIGAIYALGIVGQIYVTYYNPNFLNRTDD